MDFFDFFGKKKIIAEKQGRGYWHGNGVKKKNEPCIFKVQYLSINQSINLYLRYVPTVGK